MDITLWEFWMTQVDYGSEREDGWGDIPHPRFSGNAHQRRVKRRAWLREQS